MIYVSTFLFKLPADFCHDQVSFPLHISRSLSPLSLPISLSMYQSFYPPCLLCHCACLFVCILAVSSHAFLCLPTTLTPSLRFFLCLFIALFFPPHDPCLAIKQMYCVSVLLLIVVWLFIILIFCLCSSSPCSFDVSKLLHKTVNSPLLGTFVTSLPVFRSMCLPFFFSVCLSVCLSVSLSIFFINLFSTLRSLQCQRTSIHKNLIISFILRFLVIIILFEPVVFDHDLWYSSHVSSNLVWACHFPVHWVYTLSL